MYLRFLYAATAIVLSTLLVPVAAQGDHQKSWVGKKVIIKGPDRKISDVDKSGKQKHVATLAGMIYVVVSEDGGRIRLREKGVEGWLPKSEAVLVQNAVTFFTARIKQNEKDDHAYARRAEAQRERGEYDLALNDLNEAVRLAPSERAWFSNRGIVWANKHEYDRAIKDFDEAIRLDPRYAFAFYNRGLVWDAKREHDKAIKDFTEAIRLLPNYADAFLNRSVAWYAKKEYDKAIKDCDEGIRIRPKDAQAFCNRGLVWFAKEDYDKAIKDYTQAIHLVPKLSVAFNSRGIVWGVNATALRRSCGCSLRAPS